MSSDDNNIDLAVDFSPLPADKPPKPYSKLLIVLICICSLTLSAFVIQFAILGAIYSKNKESVRKLEDFIEAFSILTPELKHLLPEAKCILKKLDTGVEYVKYYLCKEFGVWCNGTASC